MWVALTLVAVALIGTEFMIWFLWALLREYRERTRCRVLLIRHRLKSVQRQSRGGGRRRRGNHVDVLENGVHAKESDSGLFSFNVSDTIVSGMGERPIRRKSIEPTEQRGLGFH